MTNEEWIKAGIIAARELDVPPNARIEITPDDGAYVVQKAIDRGYSYTTYETDTVSPRFWKWQYEDKGLWMIGIGYSQKCNTLVIWPDSVLKVRVR